VTIAIAEKDRIFPPAVHEKIARERIPQARFVMMPGIGHVPMIDDPTLTAQIIRESVELT